MRCCLLVLFVIFSCSVLGQSDLLYVDKQGVLRRQSDQQEQSFFGVNYTLPFAYAYRHVKAMGLNMEEVIDADVYHFARLGLDAFRVHVWDTEISDGDGNLLDNEHLRLFDYLIKKLKERRIRILMTPIAFWGNGYPDQNEHTRGFADKFKYNKKKLVTNDTAIAAQERYVKQLLLHVNPYTKLSYLDDPDIIACEINNEPAHGEDDRQTTAYIDRMADAVRGIGWKKPIFYNISQAYRNEDAFLAARVDGFTYQWYTNGLVANHTTPGNTLPYVDNYSIPYKDRPGFADKAKIVYEFDAADVRSSYMYPAMARSFRTAGFQWATQFAWDPTPLAYANTEYQTHYLNLAYTPAKAISFMIAGKAFHQVPRYKNYGGFPADTLFGEFRVSYNDNLSEWNTDTAFYYSAATAAAPKAVDRLRHVAGVGSSRIVRYGGTGAYFLDRVAPGVWRLELMPDAVAMKDPFTDASLKDTATYILWQQHTMQLQLPDLGKSFRIVPLNAGNTYKPSVAANGRFAVGPGVYLIAAKVIDPASVQLPGGLLGLREYHAPPAMSLPAVKVFAELPREQNAGQPLLVTTTVLSLPAGEGLELVMHSAQGERRWPMTRQGAYQYGVTIPGNLVREGVMTFAIKLQQRGTVLKTLRPVRVIDRSAAFELFNARQVQQDSLLNHWWRIKNFPDWNRRTQYRFEAGSNGVAAYRASADTFSFDIPFIGWQYSTTMLPSAPRIKEPMVYTRIKLRGAPANGQAARIQLILVDRDGNAYRRDVALSGAVNTYELPIASFTKGPFLLLPRPYPMFLPLWFTSTVQAPLWLAAIEKVQVFYMPEDNAGAPQPQGFQVEAIWGEP